MNKQKESVLPDSFAQEIQKEVLEFIIQGQSFSLIGMPSVGISPFLRFLEDKIDAQTILIDTYELTEFTKAAFLDLLFYKLTKTQKKNVTFSECIDALHLVAQNYKKVVLLINKIDLLSSEFSESFLGNFRTLCYENDGKVTLIFTVNKPYIDYNETAVVGSNMHIFSRYVYFKPYSNSDLLELLKIHSPEALDNRFLTEAMVLSGGHIQLLQLILRSSTPNNLLHDPYIRVLLKHILEYLSKPQQRILHKIAEGKETEINQYLLHIGIIQIKGDTYKLFSPLLTSFLLEKRSLHLSAKENSLFQLLKKSNGKIIPKEKIFEIVWKNDPESATDWALDSLLYRLRKHPLLKEKNYELINHKKLGYQLIKS